MRHLSGRIRAGRRYRVIGKQIMQPRLPQRLHGELLGEQRTTAATEQQLQQGITSDAAAVREAVVGTGVARRRPTRVSIIRRGTDGFPSRVRPRGRATS